MGDSKDHVVPQTKKRSRSYSEAQRAS